MRTFLATTDAKGAFFETPDVDRMIGQWQVRALWQGDMTYARAVSNAVQITLPPAK